MTFSVAAASSAQYVEQYYAHPRMSVSFGYNIHRQEIHKYNLSQKQHMAHDAAKINRSPNYTATTAEEDRLNANDHVQLQEYPS